MMRKAGWQAGVAVRSRRQRGKSRRRSFARRCVILALKKRGHVVAYLGDGVNDAPSLHSADIGICVDRAVDAARDAADLILLERDLAVLKEGVVEGRRTLGNIVKYILMGTSSNFSNMFSIAGASVFLPFLPMRPMQILMNNFLYSALNADHPRPRADGGGRDSAYRRGTALGSARKVQVP